MYTSIPILNVRRKMQLTYPLTSLFKWLRPCRQPLEFNYNFGSNLGLFGSGSGVNGRGAPVGFIWAEFQLKQKTKHNNTKNTTRNKDNILVPKWVAMAPFEAKTRQISSGGLTASF